MTNLMPEKRVDKNGRLVTKHVKPGAIAGANSFSAPAPSLPENQRESQIALIAAPLRNASSKGAFNSYSKLLRTYQDATLSAASEAVINGEPFASEIMMKALMKKNEGFLLLAASSSRAWSGVAEFRMNHETGLLSDSASHIIVTKMWDAYVDMTDNDTTVLYETLSHVAAEDFNPEESIETFQLEYLGKVLELDIHTRTKRDYYRSVEALSGDIDGVSDALPILMGINKGLILMDRDGYDVSTSLKSDQVMSVVQLSKTYPERMSSLVDFIKQRHTYDDDAVREFLETDATALSSGIL